MWGLLMNRDDDATDHEGDDETSDAVEWRRAHKSRNVIHCKAPGI